MRTIFRTDPTPERLRALRMEEFFKDLFFDFQDSPGHAPYRQAYTDLVDLYVRIIRDTTNWLAEDGRLGGPVGRLIADAADASDDLAVITFNHDLVIENEIYRRANLRRRWCLDEGYGAFGRSLSVLTPRSTRPLFPVHADGGCDHARPIRIFKMHGSLNWITRLNSALPTARTLSGEAGPRTVYLYNGRQVQPRTTIGRARTGRGRSVWNTWPVLIPPVYAKQALRRRVQEVWQEGRVAIEQCDRLVFFGYSLPQIDIEAEKLFERGIAATQLSLSRRDKDNDCRVRFERRSRRLPKSQVDGHTKRRERDEQDRAGHIDHQPVTSRDFLPVSLRRVALVRHHESVEGGPSRTREYPRLTARVAVLHGLGQGWPRAGLPRRTARRGAPSARRAR